LAEEFSELINGERMNSFRIALGFCVCLCANVSFGSETADSTTRKTTLDKSTSIFGSAEDINIGFCKSGETFVDLSDLYFIRNTRIKENSGDGHRISIISGQSIIIEQHKDSSSSPPIAYIFDLTDHIQKKPDVDLDIDLNFVVSQREVALFWRETLKHRSYRQGLFKFDGNQLVKVCEGIGGIDASH
jgi:hypothetical protein